MKRFFLLLSTLFLFTTHSILFAKEVINEYKTEVSINVDGSLQVTETIRVYAQGEQIKRGIYRDFPTHYKDLYGNHYQVDFQLISVMRDGEKEDYHTESIANGIRIYIGKADYFLPKGGHEFRLTYQTNRQLGFYTKADELYWNVTGNGWAFPIYYASATVHLPSGVSVDQVITKGYTGAIGDKGHLYQVSALDEHTVFFETTQRLPLHHGLSIVIDWPKGYINEPTDKQKFDWFINDNKAAIIGLIGCFILILYLISAWIKVGRDPHKGIIYPLYQPDKAHSPASMRYLKRMAYDKKTFTVALVNMAVKGYLVLMESNTKFSAKKTGKGVPLSSGEKAIAKALFATSNKVKFAQTNHKTISKALSAHEKALSMDYEKIYFNKNFRFLLPSYLISLITLILTIINIEPQNTQENVAFLCLWLTFWSLGVFAILYSVFKAWKKIRAPWGFLNALALSLFALPFILGEVVGLYQLWENAGLAIVIVLLLVICSNLFFYQWMKAPTLKGRELLDKIDGFQLYLKIAEADEMNARSAVESNPAPELSSELFEQYLPYAIALDVEKHWSKRFSQLFSQLEQKGQLRSPTWYNGSHWNSASLVGFSALIGTTLSSDISSSSVAPSSSSGGGGGGFSGGGGGGGGGGGW